MYFHRHNYKNICWWCGSEEISREHKYKKSEIEREYGKGYYHKSLSFIRSDEKDKPIKSSKSQLLLFKRPLCKKCNNQTSQPFDIAYDKFQKHIKNNKDKILKQKSVDLQQIYKNNSKQSASNLFRYFVKQICCTLADSDIAIEQQLIDFLNGYNRLPFIDFDLGIAIDALVMESKIKELQERGAFSRGEIKCILNKKDSNVRMIDSYFQYRWFRISYLVDKKIQGLDFNKFNHILPLHLLKNANTYGVLN